MKITIKVSNKLGLHARASAKLAQEAARYASQIWIGPNQHDMVDAKSIMNLMLLAVGIGTELILKCEGKDENIACANIKKLFDDKFGEGE